MHRTLDALDLIYNALYHFTDREDYPIIDILLDDGGRCIHITLEEWVDTNIIIAIGELFGDNNPSITISDIDTMQKCIKIIVLNDKRKDLIAKE